MILMTVVRASVLALLVLQLSVLSICSHAAESSETVAYGSKVRFGADRILRFPDFQVVYMGKRHVTPPQYPRGWWTYDFKVRGKGNEQTVSWSAGTGDIGPARFKVVGAEFQLELSHSDKHGTLREDEMVVSPVK